jgi:hypothetical protein
MEGTSADPIARLYDKLYVYSYALTPDTVTGWSTIQYYDSAGVDPLQLRLGVKATDSIPTWCEVSYSVEGSTWYLEDRFQIQTSHFQVSSARADLIACYQRTASSGAWAYVRSFATSGGGGGGSYSNAKSISFTNTVSSSVSATQWAVIPSALAYGKNYSISCWIKSTSTTWFSAVWFCGETNNRMHFRIQNSNGSVNLNDYYDTAATNLCNGAWHHVVVTTDGAGNIKFYKDGSLHTTATGAPVATSFTGSFRIGTNVYGNWPYAGLVDEFAIWDTVLDATAVTNIYNSGVPTDLTVTAGTNLQAYYRFEASDGTDSKNTNTLTFSSTSPSFSTTHP